MNDTIPEAGYIKVILSTRTVSAALGRVSFPEVLEDLQAIPEKALRRSLTESGIGPLPPKSSRAGFWFAVEKRIDVLLSDSGIAARFPGLMFGAEVRP